VFELCDVSDVTFFSVTFNT